jgi:hypothetical protein
MYFPDIITKKNENITFSIVLKCKGRLKQKKMNTFTKSTYTNYYYEGKEITENKFYELKAEIIKKAENDDEEYMNSKKEYYRALEDLKTCTRKNKDTKICFEKKYAFASATVKYKSVLSKINIWEEFEKKARIVEYEGIKRPIR